MLDMESGYKMVKQICPYHGQYNANEANDYSCPKCEKELYDYGQFKRTGKKTKAAKNLINRAKKGWL